MTTSELRHSPLEASTTRDGAKYAEFSGWSMPLEYAGGGVLVEHEAVRSGVGVFDVSHLGKLHVAGPGAAAYLNTRLANDLGRIGPGQAQYTLLCTPDGRGVVDDLIAYLIGPDEVLLVPNAANAARVAAALRDGAPAGLTIADRHEDYAVVAIQGPAAPAVVAAWGAPTDMDYMSFAPLPAGTICRTGYTGERGFELVVPSGQAAEVWDGILDAGRPFGIRPCGLAARDTLRTEMAYPLHGHEIGADIGAVEAGVSWAIGWDKPVFDGCEGLRATRAAGPSRRSRGLLAAGRGIPRPGMTVVADGAEIGVVTSGTFSPTLKRGIALALIDTAAPTDGVGVRIRDRVEPFDVVKPPFVPTHVR